MAAMSRDEPLDVTHGGLPAPKQQRTLNRKQRKAMEAKTRKATKMRKWGDYLFIRRKPRVR